ncbi:hypothetical protein LOC69_19260 [Blastopirellula sp. JC733]|nr:hypothetical protein [Blastopirellula sediminis]
MPSLHSQPAQPKIATQRHGIDLTATYDLHERLFQLWCKEPQRLYQARDVSMRYLRENGVRFESSRELPAATSALMLDSEDVTLLETISETLHDLVETAVDWVLADRSRLAEYFPAHLRMAPYFAKTRGLQTWQGYSRYDAVITQKGELKVIELNSCCPAGFAHAAICNDAAISGLQSLGLEDELESRHAATLESGSLVDELLAIEREAGLPVGLVALVNDENYLHNELELLKAQFEDRGRTARIVNAMDLTYRDGVLRHDGDFISLSYNKIRVSTPDSSNHCWRAGFEKRYAPFLSAVVDQAFVSVNNLVAATIAEDKTLLEVLHAPAFQKTLSGDQRDFITRHVMWTARLQPGKVLLHGEEIDLLPYLLEHKDRFVIKPANEGRGFGVTIGAASTTAAWEAACRPQANLPCVVQEFAAPASLPVLYHGGDKADLLPVEMFITVAMGIIRGQYRGLFSRISPEAITNVGKAGIIQAVLQQ